jgi:hypothetical protein
VKTTKTGELWDESLRLNEITRKLKAEAGNATHFVVFDACRNTLKLTRRAHDVYVTLARYARPPIPVTSPRRFVFIPHLGDASVLGHGNTSRCGFPSVSGRVGRRRRDGPLFSVSLGLAQEH